MADRFAGKENDGVRRVRGKRYGTLSWHWVHGIGEVTLSEEFEKMYFSAKLDFLSDVMDILQREYDTIANADEVK